MKSNGLCSVWRGLRRALVFAALLATGHAQAGYYTVYAYGSRLGSSGAPSENRSAFNVSACEGDHTTITGGYDAWNINETHDPPNWYNYCKIAANIPTGQKITQWLARTFGKIEEGFKTIANSAGLSVLSLTYETGSTPLGEVTDDEEIALAIQYDWITYKICFDKNATDATGTMADMASCSYPTTYTLSSNGFSRPGYTFSNWQFGSKTFVNGASVSGASFDIANHDDNAVVTLKANWSRNSYPLTLTPGTGIARIGYKAGSAASYTYVNSSTTVQVPYGTAWSACAEPKTGYSCSATGSGTMGTSGASFNPSAKAIDYHISYERHGGTPGATSPTYASYGGSFYVSDPTQTGASFLGWRLSGTASYETAKYGGTAININNAITAETLCKTTTGETHFINLCTNDSASVTLTAIWDTHTYNIAYALNGGSPTATYPETVGYTNVFAICSPTKYGHTFTGWNVSSGLNTSTAQWSQDNAYWYSIAQSWTLMKPASANPNREVYLKQLTSTKDGSVTLNANWCVNTNTVTFEISGAENNPTKSVEVVYGGDLSPITTVPVYANADVFKGYYTERDGKGTQYWDAEGNPVVKQWQMEGDQTFYEYKGGLDYTLCYDANGGSGTIPSQACNSRTDVTLSDGKAFSRDAYILKGWSRSPNGEYEFEPGSTTNCAAVNPNRQASTTLYACWAPNTVTINVDGNGGEAAPSQLNVTIGHAVGTLPTAQWKHHSLVGWFTARHGGDPIYAETKITNDTLKTIYAHWTTNAYYVAYNGNGATNGTMDVQVFRFDEKQALATNRFQKAGYTFDGWATNGIVQKAYQDGQIVENICDTDNATNTLYALWLTNTYTVVYDPNGGEGTMADQPFVYDQSQQLRRNTYQSNWNFLCWTNEVSGKTYADMASVMNLTPEANGVVTLKALWDDQPTDLSLAMHCTNMSWRADADSPWTVSTKMGYDADHTSAKSVESWQTMSAGIGTNAVILSFQYQPMSSDAVIELGLLLYRTGTALDDVSLGFFSGAEETWTNVVLKLDALDMATYARRELYVVNRKNRTVYIDQMKCTINEATPVPSAEDIREPTGFERTATGFTLSIGSSDTRFAYRLLYSTVLPAVEWLPVEGSRQEGTGDALSFPITPQSAESQKFFKVEVLAK